VHETPVAPVPFARAPPSVREGCLCLVTEYFTVFATPQVVEFVQKASLFRSPGRRKFLQIISWKASAPGGVNPNTIVLVNFLENGMDFATRFKNSLVNDTSAFTPNREPIR
jgi:hypothetical protein